jgi:predicted protein tyrosine phosphatase
MKIRLTICDRHFAAHTIRGPHPYTHLISIGDAAKAYPVNGFENVKHGLALFFDDITQFRPGWTLPAVDHVQQLLRFARSMVGQTTVELLVHCEQGISRSTAAAFIVMAYHLGPHKEAEAMAEILHARPQACPNELMVDLADQLLRREGRMVRELQLARMMRQAAPYGSGY